MNAQLSDIATFAVEVRQLRERVAMLEAEVATLRTVKLTPLLSERIIEIVTKRPGIRLRELMRALAAEGALEKYRSPLNAVWMTISREPRLRRVGRGKYAVNGIHGEGKRCPDNAVGACLSCAK